MSIEAMKRVVEAFDALPPDHPARYANLQINLLRTAIQQATQPAEVTDATIDAIAAQHTRSVACPTRYVTDTRAVVRAILAMRPVQVPMTDEQHPLMVFAIEAEMGAYQENEIPIAARKAIAAAKTYGITAQAKKETP